MCNRIGQSLNRLDNATHEREHGGIVVACRWRSRWVHHVDGGNLRFLWNGTIQKKVQFHHAYVVTDVHEIALEFKRIALVHEFTLASRLWLRVGVSIQSHSLT